VFFAPGSSYVTRKLSGVFVPFFVRRFSEEEKNVKAADKLRREMKK
jgi:hypothetical protein